MAFDYSTLDLDKLAKLPEWNGGRPGFHLQRDPGNGCAGDPPGYPTYFTQNIYTGNGNEPSCGPTQIISVNGRHFVTMTADGDYEKQERMFRDLWKPLSLDHPRTRAWILATHIHHANCYYDAEGLVEPYQYGKPTFFVFPLPHYKLRHFHDDPRFSDDWRAKERAAVEQANADLQQKAQALATPDNHMAVRIIRRYYPEYQPEIVLINSAPHRKFRPGDWWERLAERPTPDQCKPPSWLGAHRSEGWCQFCGYVDNK